ncbi:esterase lipase thioesterase family protein [Stylonychia lemnae]|uniref:Esterase lipase thioesterase family protein n=1 Tax=Stylonychia lemnae TaxID=5949 RepID=A0A078A386_STYLE|nr:esterase lipase thioesterase family protein [Stylonychia lemnae]|eukprot:CDW76738.1 esterase lipase thioesterase family protein [Stylonychia lemnae]
MKKTLYYKILGGLGIGSAAYYPIKISNTDFYYQKTEENEKILKLCSQHLNKYMPSLHLLPHGAFQVVWNLIAAKDRHYKIQYQRDVLTMSDGGSISVDWAYPSDEDLQDQKETKICMIFPGLSGDSNIGYVKCLVKHLTQEKGYIVGIFHNRGIDTEYTSPHFADISSSEEMDVALKHMIKKFSDKPNPRYVGVGMSMGANLMLKIAGEQEDRFPLEAMVSLNNPFDIWLAINLMRGKPYEKFLAIELRKNTLIKEGVSDKEREIFKEMQQKYNLDYERLKTVDSWRDFDAHFTLKVHPQFKSVAQYYYAASCFNVIQGIKKPTLVIHSKDDPIIPIECLPLEDCIANEKLIMGIVRKGGHVCYFQGFKGQKRWYPQVSSEYLEAVLSLKNESQHESQGLSFNRRVAI